MASEVTPLCDSHKNSHESEGLGANLRRRAKVAFHHADRRSMLRWATLSIILIGIFSLLFSTKATALGETSPITESSLGKPRENIILTNLTSTNPEFVDHAENENFAALRDYQKSTLPSTITYYPPHKAKKETTIVENEYVELKAKRKDSLHKSEGHTYEDPSKHSKSASTDKRRSNAHEDDIHIKKDDTHAVSTKYADTQMTHSVRSEESSGKNEKISSVQAKSNKVQGSHAYHDSKESKSKHGSGYEHSRTSSSNGEDSVSSDGGPTTYSYVCAKCGVDPFFCTKGSYQYTTCKCKNLEGEACVKVCSTQHPNCEFSAGKCDHEGCEI
mmetsp:Transcript_27706/g.38528  ORF Transcript_27706/g.38528 Transcript_27706/m.38528 type:complete len:330 (-) Transcript_27706:419-1408(-)|eukprot:CAMPEP_0184491180 /NCGR_PEP_ID=MMETSP0113_2-20130426/19780_1 /TAXON_ID=91329 /ORGANISM="Norrisiella sphaerica, Strain BC52" /LENGTH=329 /DNA_ID=CAMNT_0026875443 /DNA_START=167 /DNA_END=1156 /DNA_ORIENTATION=+